MPTFRWQIDAKKLQEYYDSRMDRPSIEKVRKYYRGFRFNTIKRECMYSEELEDLELVYRSTLKNLHKQVENILPSLLHYMDEFLCIHKQNEAVREKLDLLLDKMGKEPEDDGEDDE